MARMAICAAAICSITAMTGVALAEPSDCRESKPVATLQAMWDALGKCWQPPVGSEGLEVTVRFSLKRDGTLNGKPQITWLKRGGTEAERRAFVASVFRALESTLPIPFTESMGKATAGRPMTMRFTSSTSNEKTL